MLRQLYGLTTAEAEAAAAIISGSRKHARIFTNSSTGSQANAAGRGIQIRLISPAVTVSPIATVNPKVPKESVRDRHLSKE